MVTFLRHRLPMQTPISFTLHKYSERKVLQPMLILQNLSGKRNYKTSILQTMAGCYYSENFRTFGSQTGQMDTRTNGSRTNGLGLGLGQGNNCPGPIYPRIIQNINSQ